MLNEEYEIEMIEILRKMKVCAQKMDLAGTKPLEAQFQKILTAYMIN